MPTQPATYSEWLQKEEWDKYPDEESTILQVESQDQSKTTIKREEIPNEQGSEGRQKQVRLLN